MSKMKCLDLYCGLGGWTEGFMKEGFECTGYDIIKLPYPGKLIIKDVRKINPKHLPYYEVIVGSPPCRDFTKLTNFANKWKKPVNIWDGLSMVYAFLNIVSRNKPKYWILENVPRLINYIELNPRCSIKMHKRKTRLLFGNFPNCLIPRHYQTQEHNLINVKYRSHIRAKIPLCISQTLAKAIKERL